MRLVLPPLFLFVLASVRAQDAPNQAPNQFLQNNPNYRQRAGSFYEQEYLPGAAAGLARAARNPRLTEPVARRLLRAFIDDWLDAYIAGDGAISPADYTRVVRRFDDQVGAALCDDAAHARYLLWRSQAQGGDNPLAFLMRPPRP